MSFFEKLFGSFSDKELKRINPLKDKVLALEPEMAKLTDEELQAKTTEFKERLAKGETLDDLLPEAFAVCREAAWRAFDGEHLPANELTEPQKLRLMAAIDELKELHDQGGCPCSVTDPDGKPGATILTDDKAPVDGLPAPGPELVATRPVWGCGSIYKA